MLPTDHLESLGDALRDACMAHRSRVALIEVDRQTETRRLSYGEVEQEALAVAARLRESGVGPGDRVAILMSNQSRWLTSATGVFWCGATLVPVDYKSTAPEQAAVLAHARVAAIVTEWPIWRELEALLPGPAGRPVLLVAHAPEGRIDDALRWDRPVDPAARATSAEADRSASRDDVACIVYSSGTGGDVKGCMLTHGNYLAQAQSLGRLFPMEPGERFFSILPTNHAIDFMTGFLMPLSFGATVVHQRSLRPEFLRFTLRRYGITHIAAVPRILSAFEERVREKLDGLDGPRRALVDGLIRLNETLTLSRPRHGLSSRLLAPLHAGFGGRLRYVFAGGAFVEPELAEFFYRLGIPVVIGYGLTEAGTVLTVNDLKPFRSDTVGRPVDGVELELRDAGPDGIGEVWARSPTVMAGYFDNPELTAETIVDGWLRTGDLGWIDASGHLHLVGRARNMIVTEGGKNVYPEDVEAAFAGIPGVEELCVFATDYVWPRGSMTGETLVVVVRPTELGGAGPDAVELNTPWFSELARRNRRLTDYKRVASVLVWRDEFPRTASLKVKRSVLAEVLRAGSERAAMRPLEENPATEAVG